MAASYTVVVQCSICKRKVTITNTTEAALGNTSEKKYQCPECGQRFDWNFTSIALVHSASVGSNTTITHTVTVPGSIATAVS
jgi:uncharacterized protein YlaI